MATVPPRFLLCHQCICMIWHYINIRQHNLISLDRNVAPFQLEVIYLPLSALAVSGHVWPSVRPSRLQDEFEDVFKHFMRAMISRKRCKSRGARNIRRWHRGKEFFRMTQRLQARQSTCICFHFKSLRLRSRALQSLPSAASMSSNALENGVPNEEKRMKVMASPHPPRAIVAFSTCPWVAGLCLSAMIGRFSFMAAVSKSFSGVQGSETSAILHKTRQRIIPFKRLGNTDWTPLLQTVVSLPASSEGSQTPPTSSLCTWLCTLQRPAIMRDRGRWKSGTSQRILEGWNAVKENYSIYLNLKGHQLFLLTVY